MPGLPAHCDYCGLTFVSDVIFVENSSGITFTNTAVPCPRCNNQARAIEGTFDFVGDSIRAKRATPSSLAILNSLQNALKKAQEGSEIAAVLASIENSSPELARLVGSVGSRGGLYSVIAMLLYLLASCAQNTESSLDWNKLVDQAHVYITGTEPYPFPGAPETTRKPHQKTANEAPSEKKERSRQQKRQEERQNKKQQKNSQIQAQPKDKSFYY